MKIIHVIGARPNYMKVAPIYAALAEKPGVTQLLVHTGQHYSPEMSALFFDALQMPQPDINLEVGSGSHAVQTAKVMEAFEPVVEEFQPDVVLVVGDVNSTIACAIVAKKLHVDVVHVEAGLRSLDMKMPEEVNRVLTDRISDWLFTTEPSGTENLLAEGVPADKIKHVGNTMIDSLVRQKERAAELNVLEEYGQVHGEYLLGTIHRPSNVDEEESLTEVVQTLLEAAERLPLLLPLHPRTQGNMEKCGVSDLIVGHPRVTVTGPLGYLEFLRCQLGARVILTDSGGIQEEASYLGVPCLTMRENTERPITLDMGTNRLVGTSKSDIIRNLDEVMALKDQEAPKIPLWDGLAGVRIADELCNIYQDGTS